MQGGGQRLWISGRSVIVALIVLGVLVLGLATTTGAQPSVDGNETAPCEMTIEFVKPKDWRCSKKNSDPCTVCRNVSDHSSELLVACVDSNSPKRRQMPPGAELSVCDGDKQPALNL